MKKLITALLLTSVLVGCGKEEIKKGSGSLTLNSPELNEEVNPVQPTFTWTGAETGNYQFTLSKSQDFANPVLDTVLSTNTFQIPENYNFKNGNYGALDEKSTYFWKVTQGNNSASSTFKTTPYLTIFGSHNVIVTNYYSSGNNSYPSILQIDPAPDNKITISITGGISGTLGPAGVSASSVNYMGSNSSLGYNSFSFNPKTRNLKIEFNREGLGGNGSTYIIDQVID